MRGTVERVDESGWEDAFAQVSRALDEAGVDAAELLAAGHRVVHGGDRYTAGHDRRRRRGAGHRGAGRAGAAAQPAGPGRDPRHPRGVPRPAPGGGLRHRLLRRAAGRRGDVRPGPGGGRGRGIRRYGFARDQPRARRGRGRPVPRPARGPAGADRPPPGQRRLRRGGPGRPARRHLDGADAAGGAGDGHPPRRPRPGRAAAPAPPRLRRRPSWRSCCTTGPVCRGWPAGTTSATCWPPSTAATSTRGRRTTSTATGSASTSAPTSPCSAAPTPWSSPPGSASTCHGCARTPCSGLTALGIEVDPARNRADADGPRRVGADGSRVDVLVVPTDEELRDRPRRSRDLLRRRGRVRGPTASRTSRAPRAGPRRGRGSRRGPAAACRPSPGAAPRRASPATGPGR